MSSRSKDTEEQHRNEEQKEENITAKEDNITVESSKQDTILAASYLQ
jgi:hypothetical protein